MASIYDNVIITKLGGILIAAGKAIKEEVADPVDLQALKEVGSRPGAGFEGVLKFDMSSKIKSGCPAHLKPIAMAIRIWANKTGVSFNRLVLKMAETGSLLILSEVQYEATKVKRAGFVSDYTAITTAVNSFIKA